jgi:hypothetical protein
MHAMMAIKGVWLYLLSFLISATNEGESAASRFGRFALDKITSVLTV